MGTSSTDFGKHYQKLLRPQRRTHISSCAGSLTIWGPCTNCSTLTGPLIASTKTYLTGYNLISRMTRHGTSPEHDVAIREYAACVACPHCSSFSRLHSLPGPPPRRDVTGPGRYGREGLACAQIETIRKHTIVSLRIARVLTPLTKLNVPWIFECLWASEKEVSVLHSP